MTANQNMLLKCKTYLFSQTEDKSKLIKEKLTRATFQANKAKGLSFVDFDEMMNHDRKELTALLDSVLDNISHLKNSRDYFTEYYDNISDKLRLDAVIAGVKPNYKSKISLI